MADVKNFGLKGISNDVQLGKGGGRFKWVSANDRYEFTGSDGSTLKAIRAANVDVQGSLLSNDITATTVTVNGDTVITGGLTVNGTTTTVSSTNTTIADSILELATGTTGTPSNDVGLVIERGDSNNVFIGWDESADKVIVGTGTFTGSSSGALTIAVADFEAKEVKGTSITDGTASLASGALSGVTTIGASGLATVGSLTDGAATLASGSLTGAVNLTASGVVSFGTLTDSGESIAVTKFVDASDGIGNNNNDTSIPTSAAVKAYVDAADTASDLDFQGDSGGALAIDLDSESLTLAGGTGISSVGSGNSITFNLDNTAVSAGVFGSATQIPQITVDAQGRITGASNVSVSTGFTIDADSGSADVVAGGETLTFDGTANEIETSVSANKITIGLPSAVSGLTSVSATTLTDGAFSVSSGAISGATTIGASGTVTVGTLTDGAASLNSGSLSGAVNITASGVVSFGTLTDSGESIAVTKFVDESDGISNNDNDTTLPTSAAVKDYVDNNGGDGLIRRASFTANSSDSTFNIGTIPNVTGRTYYASRLILDVTTALSGGSVDGMLVKDNAGSGNTLAAATTNDIAIGTYVVDLPFASALTKNAAVRVQFVQSNGSTAATPTGGVVVGTIEYRYTQ